MNHSRRRAATRVLLASLVVVGCAFAVGLGLASTWGSTVADDNYSVTTRLIVRSQVEIPTNIGTAVFDTHAWGPGGLVSVSALALPPVERASGSPFIDLPAQVEQIKALARAAAVRSLAKYVGGALAGGLFGVVLWRGLASTFARRGADEDWPPGRGRGGRSGRGALAGVALGLAGGLLATVGWAAGVFLTFDDEYGHELHADGLLAIALSSGRLLHELDSRDQAYAGYVQSLATYITRLREDASPPAATDVAVRVMLVSDLHGRDVYPQLRSVAESQGVDLVVDAGDLVQWGTGFELSARPDIAEGIESMGVPYLWVKGNHDGPGTVEQMRKIPNVTVLDGQLTEVGGLRLLGVGDPRLYLDGGPVEAAHPDEVEEMERQAAVQAVEALPGSAEDPPPVDVAVMHHPSGARELGELTGAPVWVSGHTHVPDLEVQGDHVDITVGTTGAAGIRTFKGQDARGDVVPTPQSFDILDFNSACAPVALTRFTYPDVLSEAGAAKVVYQTLRLDPQAVRAATEAPGEQPAGEEEDSAPAPARSCG